MNKKTNILLSIFTLFALSCNEETNVYEACGSVCYSGPLKTRGVSGCKSGILVCHEDGTKSCEGEVIPGPELCDGVDNDCNGEVDDNITNNWSGISCVGPCGSGFFICAGGEYICKAFNKEPSPEICDGIDNDCDGLIDEQEDLPVEFCYSGNEQDLYSGGQCRPGVRMCQNGSSVCVGEVLPTIEICDGLDNDCNGSIDDNLNFLHKERDIVFIIDVSCSIEKANLQRHIDDIIKFADNFHDTDYTRYGLIVVGTRGIPYFEWDCAKYPLRSCDKEQLKLELRRRRLTSTGGFEPTYDAIYDAVVYHAWGISRERTIVLFADEEAQSARFDTEASISAGIEREFPSLSEMKLFLINLLIENDIRMVVWTQTPYITDHYTFPPTTVNVYNVFDRNLSTYEKLKENFPIMCE